MKKTLSMCGLAVLLWAAVAGADHHEKHDMAHGDMDLADAHLTDDERQELVDLLEDSWDEMDSLLEGVPDAQWATPPAEGKWSVSEVVEHLAMSEAFLRGTIDTALAADPDPDWRATEEKGLSQILETLPDRSQKFQAPDPLVPGGEMSREQAVEKFETERRKTLELVREMDGPVKAHTQPNPLLETANVRQWVAFLAAHNLRHNKQIAEAKEMLGL